MGRRLLRESTLDDLLRAAVESVLKRGEPVEASRGQNLERRGVLLELTNPRARLSRSESRGRIFSCLGELLWYWSGSNATDPIAYYIPDYRNDDEGGVIHGGYGPRLRGEGEGDQLNRVIELLRARPTTRRAVIQLFAATDLMGEHQEVPCTCSLQFLLRGNLVDLTVYMRSNDVVLGLPHDVFCFTMLQELVARAVGAEVGTYLHMAGSLHLYAKARPRAEAFLREGWFESRPMPAMPSGDNRARMDDLLEAEKALRHGESGSSVPVPDDPYWADLTSLLSLFADGRHGRHQDWTGSADALHHDVYRVYVDDRADRRRSSM